MTTQCVNPQEIHEGDLLAHIGGAARSGVGEHVARCLFCAAEAAALQLLEEQFQTVLYRANCPETDVLLQAHMEMLPTAERRQVQEHITQCSDCQAEVRRFLPKSITPSWRGRLRQAGRTFLEAIEVPAAMRPALVMRGVSPEELYQAGNYQVVLAKQPPIAAENRWEMEGQVIQNEEATAVFPGQVSLWQEESLIARDVVDEFGYFGLANIVAGIYTLHIVLQVDDIIIINVTIP